MLGKVFVYCCINIVIDQVVFNFFSLYFVCVYSFMRANHSLTLSLIPPARFQNLNPHPHPHPDP